MITPQTKLITRNTLALNRLLKIEIIKVNPVNHKQDAAATPEINGVDCDAVSVTWNAPSIIVPSIIAWGLNQVTTQAEEIVFRTDKSDSDFSSSSTFVLSNPIPI